MKKFQIPKMYGAVTVGERGQVVIPSQVRKMFRIKAGDKLVVIAKASGGPIGFLPAEEFNEFLSQATSMLAHMKDKSV